MSLNGSSRTDLRTVDETVREAYEDILNEPLPDRFRLLLTKLRRGELPHFHPIEGEID